MLRSVLLHIEPTDCSWSQPKALRAIAYALVDLGDPDLAARMHDAPRGEEGQAQPPPPPSMTIAAVPAELPILRVTALDVPTERALMAACDAMAAGRRLCRRDVNLAVTDCSLDAGALAGAAGAMELALSPFHPRFDVTFVTPTSFSQGGDRHLPLPVPDLIMRSWARRWNAFAPPDAPPIPPATLDAVAANVVVSRADIRTCTLDVGRGKVVAFVGDVALAAVGHRSWQPDERRAFAVLCAYSRFCGTGARTIQGFGLTLPSTSEPVGE